MDSIRSTVDAMAADETARLRERSVAEQRSLRRATTLTAVSFLAAVVLGLAAALVVSRDIDRRLRAEEEARRAKEAAEAASHAKSEFLAMMSHELRTPLNSVIGFSNVLLRNRHGHLRERDLLYVQRIRAGGQHLLSLINEVLDLSKVEAGRMRLERAPGGARHARRGHDRVVRGAASRSSHLARRGDLAAPNAAHDGSGEAAAGAHEPDWQCDQVHGARDAWSSE
jgi:signal transduction histidine kinase